MKQEYTFVYRQMWEAPGVSKTTRTTTKYLKFLFLFFLQTNMFPSNFWVFEIDVESLTCIFFQIFKICPNNFQFSYVCFFSVAKYFQFQNFAPNQLCLSVGPLKPSSSAESKFTLLKNYFLQRWHQVTHLTPYLSNSIAPTFGNLNHFPQLVWPNFLNSQKSV